MTTTRSYRRARGSATKNVQFTALTPPRTLEFADQVAHRMHMSRGQALEEILDHLELTEDGVPTWYKPKQDELFESHQEAKAS